jgi:hypothetical protein
MLRHLITISLLAGCFSGCTSSEPSFGQQLGARSDKAQEISKQWNQGTAAVSKGESMIKKGNNLVEDGQKDQKKGQQLIEDGQQLVENGKKQVADAEAAYRAMAANPIPTTTTPSQ